MKIHTVIHKTARRDGKPVKTFKLRYEETVRDLHTGQPTGRKRSRSETYPRFDAADALRREIEAERAGTGAVTSRDARSEPFATYAGLWSGEERDAVALGDLKAHSIADREGTLRRYALPRFAATPVGSISRADAREFRSALIARELAPATVKGAFDAFRRVLDIAMDNGVLPANPAILRRKPHPPRPRFRAPAALEGAAGRGPRGGGAERRSVGRDRRPGDPLPGLHGVRAAELCGLNVGDLRLTARGGLLHVRRTRKRTGGAWVEDTPKSVKSTRRVPLPGWLAERLAAYLDAHPHGDDPMAPLFPGKFKGGHTHGTRDASKRALGTANWSVPIEPTLFYKNVLTPALRAAGLPVSEPRADVIRAVAEVFRWFPAGRTAGRCNMTRYSPRPASRATPAPAASPVATAPEEAPEPVDHERDATRNRHAL